MGQLPELLRRFHEEALSCFVLPSLSQKIVTLTLDRDAGSEQLVVATRGNPAAAAWLSLEWERQTGKVEDRVREVDYWIPRLGMERCRRVWIAGQLQSLWGVPTDLPRARRIAETVESWRQQKKDRDPSFGDSAFLGGLLFDLLWIAASRREPLSSTSKLVYEARFKRFEQGLLKTLEQLEAQKSFLARRWVVAVAASVAVAELWIQLEDPQFAARMIRWDSKALPLELKRLLMRRTLGFSPKVIAAWILDQFPQLESYREVARLCETPAALAAERREAHQLAVFLGSSPELG
jgi:hypothetical protein